jgi:hypothetical protein
MGWTESQIEVHEKSPVHLYGFRGDKREQTAHVVIRRKHVGESSNDIGFFKDPQTGCYTAIVSDYDRRSMHYNQEWLQRLYTYANVEKAKMDAKAEGKRVEERVDDKGRPQLEIFFEEKAPKKKTKVSGFFG